MKQILVVLLLCVCMPSISMANSSMGIIETGHGIKSIIHLKVDPYVRDGVGKGKRSPIFIPIAASHNAENLYLSSRISIENATVVVKDEWGNVVYEMSTSIFSGQEIVLPLSLSGGRYTLEIMYGSICLCGDFEI